MQVLKTEKLRVHGLNVILLGIEGFEEFEEVLFRADVFVQAQLLYYLAEFERLSRPLCQSFIAWIELVVIVVSSLHQVFDSLLSLFEAHLLLQV